MKKTFKKILIGGLVLINLTLAVSYSDIILNTNIASNIGIDLPVKNSVTKKYTVMFVNKSDIKTFSFKENEKISFEKIEDENFLGWSKSNNKNDLISDLASEKVKQNVVYFAMYKDQNSNLETPVEEDKTIVAYIMSDGSQYGLLKLDKGQSISIEEFKYAYKNDIFANYKQYPDEYLNFDKEIIVSDFKAIDLLTREEIKEIDTSVETLLIVVRPYFKLKDYNYGLIYYTNNQIETTSVLNGNLTYAMLRNYILNNYDLSKVIGGSLHNDFNIDSVFINIWDLFDEELKDNVLENGIYHLFVDLQEEKFAYSINNIVVKNLRGEDVIIEYFYEAKDFYEIDQHIKTEWYEKYNIVSFADYFGMHSKLFLDYEYATLRHYHFSDFVYNQEKSVLYLNWDFQSAFDILNKEEPEMNIVTVKRIALRDKNGIDQYAGVPNWVIDLNANLNDSGLFIEIGGLIVHNYKNIYNFLEVEEFEFLPHLDEFNKHFKMTTWSYDFESETLHIEWDWSSFSDWWLAINVDEEV